MEENYFIDNQTLTKTHNFIRWKSGKLVDPRLLTFLESFGEIYVERRELFKRIFDEKYEELFETIGHALRKRKKMKKAKSMRRSMSMSMRAIGERGIDEETEGLKLERFRVKTPKVIVVDQDGSSQGGQPPITQDSSKDPKLL